ncbi:Methionyl-tRNA formyltransferase [Thermodesulfobium narugense DSM 14796]|uniref:Methionyl-tRNA formyltransferase n=1 Tax=Thermodesulfobium narugense DSM 14796 TaxID=747365 RepID=M1E7G2_9BACT|nr:methionyl-tRNA formyltransferase [Thermodesulfobium narugense]AEE14633.1 Methionyl-tRNA formyltransferase [Thermodesulfobium narugense DSM 14796]
MDLIFFGTPIYSVNVLERLEQSKHRIVGIVTKKPSPFGRKKILKPSPVETFAKQNCIPLYVGRTKDKEFLEFCKELNPEIGVVAFFGEIIPTRVIDLFKYKMINLHPSLLPKYRGIAPVPRTILNGENIFGITIHEVIKELDAGDIYDQISFKISEKKSSGELLDFLSKEGSDLLVHVLDNIEKGCLKKIPQNHKEATYAEVLKLDEVIFSFNEKAIEIERKVLAANPDPIARTKISKGDLLVYKAYASEGRGEPSKIVGIEKDALKIGTGEGIIILLEVQFPGKNRIKGKDLLNGLRLKIGDFL